MREAPESTRPLLAWGALGLAACAVALALGVTNALAPAGLLVAALLSQVMWVGLAVAAVAFQRRAVAASLGFASVPASRRELRLWILGFCGLSSGLSWLLRFASLDESGSLGAVAELLAESRGTLALLAVLALGIAPGIGEEIFFRGFLQRWLRDSIGALCVPAAALAFALAHIDAVHATAAFPLGLYLGVLALRTGSTLPAIVAHSANNTLAVLGAITSNWVFFASLLAIAVCVDFAVRRITAGAPIQQNHEKL